MQRFGLYAAIALPLGYFGLQVLLAPLYPNYSFLRNAASDLGAPPSGLAGLFNLGAIVLGWLGLFGAWSVWRVLESQNRVWAVLLGVCVAAAGSSAVWAGVFPLPNALHSQNPFTVGLLLLPFVCVAALWHVAWSRVWLLLPPILLLAVLPIRAGVLGIDQAPIEGLLQRLLSLAAFLPAAVSGWVLLRHSNHSARATNLGGTSDAQP
jgi:hypothetical membrane protein